MRVLIVKVSSLGDIIHTLPAVSDAKKAIPNIEFDWITEEAFTEVPGWHPAVKRVIPVALRRWRKSLLGIFFNREYKAFKKLLQATQYDLIIDAQGLFKSGKISSLAGGRIAGFDKNSIREKMATRYYDDCYAVSWQQHAVERSRELFAKALGYSIQNQSADYGIDINQFASAKHKQAEAKLLFLHGTTWETKLWPEEYWIQLSKKAHANDIPVNLLWGNALEKQRATRIAASAPGVTVLDKLTLTEIAAQMIQAKAIVAVDTGLAHLAAALGCPTVALYGASDAIRTGTYGKNQMHLSATLSCSPCLNKTCHYRGEDLSEDQQAQVFSVQPPCFSTLDPDTVWHSLDSLMTGTRESGS
tara:strand:+ start:664 stop:1740 length:1077 start_codon:yes stop_codon:yes gene_type:complete